ncbi:MAG TPA: hypothetical protein VKQ52_13415 [Puia sp.]|nr:hypothetical protein [Puia sp.]
MLITTVFAACGHPASQPPKPISDSACAVSTVKQLLKWYAKKYDSIDAFQLVTMPPSEDSGWNTVNFDETARYLQTLRSSGFFTEKFLADKQTYFRDCDSNFAVHKENNRSPTGFDIDVLLFSNNTEDLLQDTIAPNIQLTGGTVTFDKYLVFTTKKEGDTCRIDNIRFVTDPDSAADAVCTRGADTTEPAIREIKREYEKIRADSSKFQVFTKDIMDESTEGGDATLYFEERQLRKAVVHFFGETGKLRSEYYFVHGKMFFYIGRETSYTKPFYIANYKIGNVKVNRCYFHNGQMIRWIDERGKLVDKTLYPAKEKELLVTDSSFFTVDNP